MIIHPRKRLRIRLAITEFLAVILCPIALPVLAVVVLIQAHLRNAGKPWGHRRSTWYWRIWWYYGYNGLYQVDWAMKRLRRQL